MGGLARQAVCTAFAVAMASGLPLAQESGGPVSGPASGRTLGQVTTAAPPPSADPVRPADANRTREELRQLLDRHPSSLAQVFRLDPTLLTSQEYLGPYPELGAFLAQHPEVARNPAFYIGTSFEPAWERHPDAAAYRMWESLQQGIFIILVFSLLTGVLVWLVRTLVDYRRWLRLTKVQTDTHTKLLDRFTSQEDLLAYMQTPAGRAFLESAPIALDSASRPLGAPLGRVLWSLQAGVVLAIVGIGVLFVSRDAVPAVAQGLWAIGIIALSLGAGFALSAGLVYLLSSRMRLFEPRPGPVDPLDAAALRGRE